MRRDRRHAEPTETIGNSAPQGPPSPEGNIFDALFISGNNAPFPPIRLYDKYISFQDKSNRKIPRKGRRYDKKPVPVRQSASAIRNPLWQTGNEKAACTCQAAFDIDSTERSAQMSVSEQILGDLHGIQRGPFADLVADTPERQRVRIGQIATDTTHVYGVDSGKGSGIG